MIFPPSIRQKYIKYPALAVAFFCGLAIYWLKPMGETRKSFPFEDSPGYISGGQVFDYVIGNESGEELSMGNFSGNVVVIVIFTVWCPSCPMVLRSMDGLAEKLNDLGVKNVKILALNAGDESLNALKIHYKAHDIQMLDVHRSLSPMAMKDIPGVPACFVFDKNGSPVWGHVGAADYNSDEFIGFIKKLAE